MATATGVYEPVSVAIDSDENMYIGEGMPIGIRRVDSLTNVVDKVITGLPADQSASLAAPGPLWVAVGKHGTLFYSEPSRNRISQVNLPEGDVQYIAGSEVCQFGGDGGPASGALLCYPEALSVSEDKAPTSRTRVIIGYDDLT